MARIAGVDLPRRKAIAYALPYIYGIGPHTARVICERVKIPLSRIWSQAARFRVIAVQNEIVVEATDSESAVIPETLAS